MTTGKIFSFLLTGLGCFISGFLTAQPAPVKWGKVTDKERDMTVCPIDSTAGAVVLCSFGKVTFDLSNIVFTKHLRIKILTQEGKKYANVEIPYNYRDGERIGDFRAQTINYSESGKQIINKVEDTDFYRIDLNSRLKSLRFAFPTVTTGSILEYEYSIYSDNFTFLEGWIFQNNEPTLHSEFRAAIWEGINYKVMISGENLLKKYEDQQTMNQWVLQNLDPLRDEPFCYNKLEYADRIRFQLKGYRSYEDFDGYSHGRRYKNFILSWTDLIEELGEYKPFKAMLNPSEKIGELLATMNIEHLKEEERIDTIFSYVVNQFSWNRNYSLVPGQNPEQLLESRMGSSCELNLLLKQLLQNAGIEVGVLILSTRENGRIARVYPLLSQFNHLILYCNTGTDGFFLDATSPDRPYFLPDIQDLGQEGLKMDSTKEEWILIEPKHGSRQDFLVNMDYRNPDTASVGFKYASLGYLAEMDRNVYSSDEGKELSAERIVQGDYFLKNFALENLEDPKETFRINAELFQVDPAANSDYLYIKPYIAREYIENPFMGKNRFLPVELPCETALRYIVNISLPNGYLIAELPRNEFHALSNDWGSFTYQCKSISKNLQVVVDIKFNRRIFHKGYFRYLSEFYSIISEKLNEMVVLKKTGV